MTHDISYPYEMNVQKGRENVHGDRDAVCRLLATVSRLFRLPIHRRPSHLLQIHATHFLVLLLAGYEQHYDQSSRLLLHEYKVSFELFF